MSHQNIVIAVNFFFASYYVWYKKGYLPSSILLITSMLILFDFGSFLGDQGNVLILPITAAVIGVCGILKVVFKKSRGK